MFGLQSNLIKLGSWLNLIQLEKNFTTLDNAASRTKSTPADDDSVDGDDNGDDNENDDDDDDDDDDNGDNCKTESDDDGDIHHNNEKNIARIANTGSIAALPCLIALTVSTVLVSPCLLITLIKCLKG